MFLGVSDAAEEAAGIQRAILSAQDAVQLAIDVLLACGFILNNKSDVSEAVYLRGPRGGLVRIASHRRTGAGRKRGKVIVGVVLLGGLHTETDVCRIALRAHELYEERKKPGAEAPGKSIKVSRCATVIPHQPNAINPDCRPCVTNARPCRQCHELIARHAVAGRPSLTAPLDLAATG